ncbi:MAG: ribose 5-phosphate isomerase B [Candidatus Sumerlaeia bacterium]|nr:ribose 5-phosphate isomerase B [Candidatus Sumerlaeia bacterium]
MKIAFGNDHRGYKVRNIILKAISDLGHEVVDVGTFTPDAVDYPDIANIVATKVANGEVDRGILVCGTGIGMAIAANKIPGVRAAVVTDEYGARMARAHNNANVLALRGEGIPPQLLDNIVRIWLSTQFEGGRHQRRLDKITQMEKRLGK